MNKIVGEYSSKIFVRHPVGKFEINIDNCRIQMESIAEKFCVDIKGRKDIEKLKRILRDIENLIFSILDHSR